MALNVVVTAGYTFPPGVPFSLAGLRRAALPTVSISGSVGPSDLAPGAVTAVAVAPDAYWYALDTGVVNAVAVTLSPAITAVEDGLLLAFKAAFNNTGAVTLAPNGLAPAPLVKNFNQALDPGDIRQGQIVVCRYQLDVNVIPAGAVYTGAVFSQAVVAGRQYVYTPGANELNLVNGGQVLTAAGTFTANGSTVTINAVLPFTTTITATLVPVSNVWQMLSQLGNNGKHFVFKGATPFRRGEAGLVPAAKAGDHNKYLRMDGTVQDAVALATAAAIAAVGGGTSLFNQQNFS